MAVERVQPTQLTEAYVNSLSEKMETYNNESSCVFDSLVDRLVKDIENTNEDIGLAEYDLKDFLVKNDAQLEEN